MTTYTQGAPLNHYSRGKTAIDEIVIHESAARTRRDTVGILAGRKLGLHLMIDRDGSVTQHAPFNAACTTSAASGSRSSTATTAAAPSRARTQFRRSGRTRASTSCRRRRSSRRYGRSATAFAILDEHGGDALIELAHEVA